MHSHSSGDYEWQSPEPDGWARALRGIELPTARTSTARDTICLGELEAMGTGDLYEYVVGLGSAPWWRHHELALRKPCGSGIGQHCGEWIESHTVDLKMKTRSQWRDTYRVLESANLRTPLKLLLISYSNAQFCDYLRDYLLDEAVKESKTKGASPLFTWRKYISREASELTEEEMTTLAGELKGFISTTDVVWKELVDQLERWYQKEEGDEEDVDTLARALARWQQLKTHKAFSDPEAAITAEKDKYRRVASLEGGEGLISEKERGKQLLRLVFKSDPRLVGHMEVLKAAGSYDDLIRRIEQAADVEREKAWFTEAPPVTLSIHYLHHTDI
jgi:hypothetical protein